jgi:opacity protein-like surface antigen
LKFAPELPISPYIATGVGFARYNNTSRTSSAGTIASDRSIKAVWDLGGGIDWKLAPFVSARAEVRNFHTGSPDLVGLSGGGSQDNIIPQVGLVFRF